MLDTWVPKLALASDGMPGGKRMARGDGGMESQGFWAIPHFGPLSA